MEERLSRYLDFIVEIDKLKGIERQTLLTDASRHENSAEHSWHIATMAVLLHEYGPEGVDTLRVLRMLLIHDVVEVDAGDTFCYDEEAHRDKEEREREAARRLFSLLPPERGAELHDLWEEFEERKSAEARFANALDRFQPLLHNFHTRGASWQRHGVTRRQVIERNCVIAEGAPRLWDHAKRLIDEAVERGFLDE